MQCTESCNSNKLLEVNINQSFRKIGVNDSIFAVNFFYKSLYEREEYLLFFMQDSSNRLFGKVINCFNFPKLTHMVINNHHANGFMKINMFAFRWWQF